MGLAGTPQIPLGIGPPNVLTVSIAQGDSELDLTTVTAIAFLVTKLGQPVQGAASTSQWSGVIASGATSTVLVATYTFQQPSAAGTFTFTTGSANVTATATTPVPIGALLFPQNQPGVFYQVVSASANSLTLANSFTGTTGSGISANYTIDANVLGTYDIAIVMTTQASPSFPYWLSGPTIPAYAFQINVQQPSQTAWRS